MRRDDRCQFCNVKSVGTLVLFDAEHHVQAAEPCCESCADREISWLAHKPEQPTAVFTKGIITSHLHAAEMFLSSLDAKALTVDDLYTGEFVVYLNRVWVVTAINKDYIFLGNTNTHRTMKLAVKNAHLLRKDGRINGLPHAWYAHSNALFALKYLRDYYGDAMVKNLLADLNLVH